MSLIKDKANDVELASITSGVFNAGLLVTISIQRRKNNDLLYPDLLLS